VFNPSISASTNRINLDQDGDSVNDYAFDSSGNTTKDANGRTFVYDAENKQIEVKNASNETIGQYWYDGDGRRVKKRGWINGQWETTVFVYDASSRLVAEYSTILNPTPQVAYLTNDHLGSPRINTNENGAVVSRHDYRPYGEETTERTHSQYAADTIRKQLPATNATARRIWIMRKPDFSVRGREDFLVLIRRFSAFLVTIRKPGIDISMF